MPFYHAVEATAAIKPILGDYYLFDNTPIVQALWREGSLLYVSAYFSGVHMCECAFLVAFWRPSADI